MNDFSDRVGFFDGEKGKSLWQFPLMKFGSGSRMEEILSHTKNVNDDRMLSLLTALLIENRVEHILSEMLPKFSALLEDTDFTFSMKLRLLESFNIIPIQLIRSAGIIRKIRNAFAHDIANIKFENLDKKLLSKLIGYREYIYRNKETKEQQTENKNSYFKSYNSLSWYCMIGLDSYIENAEAFANKFYSIDSVESIYKDNYIVNNQITDAFLKLSKGEQKIIGNFLVAKTEDDKGFFQELKPKRPFKVSR
ncbi:MAG: hypothetical protein HY895_10675 [Deltaproteobacteria bacterium]|nr:hypothetical protein [Deltaproteobacteria bacterium]